MSDFISYFRVIRVAMLRMCCGVIFVGLVVVAHKAQSEEGFFARDLDILTIQPVFSGTDLMFSNRIKTDSAFSRSDNIAPVESGVSNTLQHTAAGPCRRNQSEDYLVSQRTLANRPQ